jgi:hypothetical protein
MDILERVNEYENRICNIINHFNITKPPHIRYPAIVNDLKTLWGAMTYIKLCHNNSPETTVTENKDGTVTFCTHFVHYKSRLMSAAKIAKSSAIIDLGGDAAEVRDFMAFLNEIENGGMEIG